MVKIADNMAQLVGNTPLLKLSKIMNSLHLDATVVAKIEAFNPGGSVKDRIALAMIEDAEKSGMLKPGGTIIEPTSGNTGIGLAWIAAVKGYKVILTMPETMSLERRKLLQAYGATLVLTPGSEGMAGAIRKAEELRDNTPGAVILQQFDNRANPKIHSFTTAKEIWRDTDGEVDILVAGVGTGGTLTGTAEGLKEMKPSIEAVAVEPTTSAVLSGEKAGPHKIQGIGAGFIPGNYHHEYVDKVMKISDEEAFEGARMMAREEGVLVGISSGAALAGAIKLAKQEENTGKMIVVIMPDSGERYLSTTLFD